MKKLMLLLCLTFVGTGMKAYDEVGVEKTSMTAGAVTEVWFYLNLDSYEDVLQSMLVDVQFPDGWTVATSINNYSDACKWDYDFDEQGTSSHFAGSGAKRDGFNRYVVYSSDKKPFKGSNGRFFSIKVKAPAGTADGYYPVKILASSYATKSAVDAENITWEAAQTSYVVVGTPTDATLALEGVIPSFVNTALASETGISTLDLSAVTASNGTFTYVDGREVVEPTAEVKGNVAYTRAAQDKVASIKLPFAATTGTYYKLNDTDFTDNYAHFDAANGLEANTSALVNAGDAVSESAENVKIAGVAAEEISSGCYVLKGGDFCAVNGTVTVPVMRGYFEIPTSVRGFVLNGVTGINGINAADEAETIYNVAGQKLAKTQRGINIVNGKKVTVK